MVKRQIFSISRLIVVEHSVFALPFALSAFLLAKSLGSTVELGHSLSILIVLICVCAVSARSAAMAFNRIIDLKFDRENPRTLKRELVTGELKPEQVWLLVAISSVLFIYSSYEIGSHCGNLSWFVLLGLFFYSLSKRFTSLAHIILGLALACAPGGAWWVLRPQVETVPLLLMAAVTLWVGGFDIIYACQDEEFDREQKLFSIPARLGVKNALRVSKVFHLLAIIFLALVGIKLSLSKLYFFGLAPIALMFLYQHSLVSSSDLSKVNRAFFTVNGWVSLYYLSLIIVITL